MTIEFIIELAASAVVGALSGGIVALKVSKKITKQSSKGDHSPNIVEDHSKNNES